MQPARCIRLALVGCALLLAFGCAKPADPTVRGAESVEIYSLPESTETVVILAPEDLRRIRTGYLTLDNAAVATAAWQAAHDDVEVPYKYGGDVRWGMRIFGDGTSCWPNTTSTPREDTDTQTVQARYLGVNGAFGFVRTSISSPTTSIIDPGGSASTTDTSRVTL